MNRVGWYRVWSLYTASFEVLGGAWFPHVLAYEWLASLKMSTTRDV